MTVPELIRELKKVPPDLKVIVRGYENGFNDVISVKMQNIVETEKPGWWDGKYQVDNNSISTNAVEIFGDNYIPRT
jgi:hypothetical protein